jgi:hypothetical protein
MGPDVSEQPIAAELHSFTISDRYSADIPVSFTPSFALFVAPSETRGEERVTHLVVELCRNGRDSRAHSAQINGENFERAIRGS